MCKEKLPCDRECDFLRETIDLLNNDKRTLLEIYAETKIPYHWLQAVSTRKIKNPSINRIYYLRSALLK